MPPAPQPCPDASLWLRLFPAADYRLPMNLQPGEASRFWALSPEAPAVLAERQRWVAEFAAQHFLFLPGAAEALVEALRWFGCVTGRSFCEAEEAAVGLEPDWVLLNGESASGYRVLGGAVIFPSGWGLEEKLGHPLAEVHGPVPGLAEALGDKIATFLSRIAPGAAWERDNWGLSAEPSLNHHPARQVPRLGPSATLDTTWLRLEQQFLSRLPQSGAILFGIRVTNHRLDHVIAAHPELASRIARTLATLPAAMAAYKGLAAARETLVTQLKA